MTDDSSSRYYVINQRKLETYYQNRYVFQRNLTLNRYRHDHCTRQFNFERFIPTTLQEQKDSPSLDKISIIVQKKNRHEKRTKLKNYKCAVRQSAFYSNYQKKESKCIVRHYSMQELFKQYKQNKFTSGSTHVKKKKSFNSYNIKNVENGMSEYGMSNNKNLFNNTLLQTSWKVYRCQLNTQEETCCCSCNSDAMFEVMKSLYDCYKKKNCDNCNCILCGHFPREERRLGELRKSSVGLASVTVETASDKERKKEQMKMTKGAAAMMIGKSPEEKEKILTDLAKNGVPLPKPKIASEKELIKKVTTKLELPPKPKTAAEKAKYKEAEAAGLIIPLEGKTTAQKENILRKQAELGIQLPQGRTASEKALIEKVKPAAGLPLDIEVPSEKIRKAKAAGYITPLKGKSPEQKEKILRGLAMNEIPLPEGKTTSEKKLIAKVRNDLGLPPEPKTASQKAKYNKAVVAGIITPLKGKSSTQKEKILRQQAELGLPLPRGRNPSEKALIAKVKGTTSVVVPSEKLRKAKAAGFITPIEGKTLDQKEKILKGLATHGIPLPEGKTASEKKIIAKVRTELGLPPEPKTSSDKEKYNKAMASGLITPLEGKTAVQKEKILKEQAGFGLTLPEGRTVSEKALIAKVKATTRPVSAFVIPSEKLRKAKAAGLITPLQGKPPEVKEKILKGLVMHGIPLPEGKSPSEKRIIAKVRNALGLPPEPKTASQKEKYNKALAAGVISPLEGKTAAQKERVLREQANLGVPLPEGRTPSEKALIAKMKETAKPPSAVFIPSEKLRKAKAAGFLTPLEGKTLAQKQKILKGLAMEGIPLPEGKSASEKKLIDKVRNELGLPPSPKSPSTKEKYDQAMATGFITPLEGKSAEQKEKVLKKQAKLGLPLPDGRTSSEKALIAKVKAKAGLPSAIAVPSEKLRKAKAAGVLTPLEGKTPEQKQKILKGMVKHGIPLPEGNTSSEKKIIRKIRAEVGLPPEPKNAAERAKYKHALAAGIITPLEGKSESQKEKILRGQADMGLPLPEGRTPSEKALIQNIKVATTAERKRTKSRGLVYGSPALSPDQARILDEKTAKVMKEGKGPSDDCICPLLTPESERLAKTSKIIKEATKITSKKLKAAKAAGFLTPLEGKSPAQKEKILRRLIKDRIPLPESKTQSDKKIIAKVRADVGLPPEPETLSLKVKYAKAQTSGLLTPLDGKSPTQKEKNLKGLAEIGVPLPEGRTSSEQALIRKVQASVGVPSGKVTSEKLRKAKAAGLITPLEGKTPEQKEHVLRGLAVHGIPLPEGNTPSEKKLIDKVRNDLGLPPEPTTSSAREKYQKAVAAGIVTPLEGKTPLQKEKILRAQADIGLSLPAGRTPSEKILIANIKATTKPLSVVVIPSEKLRKAKAAGILTPLEGKTPEQKEKILRGLAMQGIPLPKGKSISEKRLVGKVRYDLGLPPEPKTSSHKDKYNKAMAAGVVTPLEGKSATQKENILRGQAEVGLPLPEGRTSSEKALIAKVKATTKSVTGVALPSEKLRKAKAAGLITPLEGKTPEEKENILRGLADIGLPLPEGRTPSERALIEKVKATGKVPSIDIPSEKIRKAKAAGLTTPLDGKTTAQKEKILRGLAMNGISLPEGKTASEKKIINKVRKDVGLPSAPKTLLTKETYNKAMAAGIITPLEGKSPAQKEKILTQQAEMGLPLPEGRTPSEKALIDNIKATTKAVPLAAVPLEKLRKAKAEGLITPLQGKTPEQREKILKGLASQGIPLPEGKTASEKRIIDKVRKEVGLPPEPKTLSQKEKYNRAIAAGVITPLKGKTTTQKEKIIRQQAEMGIPLPEGRTTSEKALIANIKATTEAVSATAVRPEKLRKAKAAGFITPLEGKAPEQIEKIIKGLAMHGIPLPKGKTASEKKIIDKVRQEVGLPPQPKTLSQKDKYNNAMAAGLITPLEGKSVAQKEKILKGQAELGLPLPEGRTLSEKALISKVKATVRALSGMSEKLRKAKAAGLLTPLEGKSPEEKEKILKGLVKAGIPLPEGKSQSEQAIIDKVRAEGPKLPSERIRQAKAAGLLTPLEGKTTEQKENILRGLVKAGVPLPEGKTPSEKELLQKIREEVGLPPEPKTPSMKEKYKRAQKAGIITPLEGRTKAQKEIILKRLHDAALPLPEGRTPSEKSIVRKVRAGLIEPSKVPSAKLKAAKAAGFLTPLEGKTPAQKEKKLIGLAKSGMPLPEGKTLSEKDLINKVRTEMGLPPEPKSPSLRKKMEKAQAAGIITPLEGKSTAQKEKILKNMAKADVPLPEGRTPSEKALISQVQAEISGPPALPAKEAKKLDKITAKVMKEGKGPSDECICPLLIPESQRQSLRKKMKITSLLKSSVTRPVASEKIRTAKAAGFLTPLEGKTAKQKEKIIIGLAEAGLPLPEGKTASEKALIHKVKTEFGIPPEARTLSEKEIIQKAKAEGLITPLVGKTSEQKKKILRGLAEAGLPMPEGKTASEKEVVKKIRTEAGLPAEPTPSEKRGIIKTKSKKIGVAAVTKSAKEVGVVKLPAGIEEDFQDIIKTTTCDRGCGCDKKKIRFKHSYVKIRVTSPDISSLCPCPDECVPGVKNGVFTDNEGIKVTVGRAIGIPSYTTVTNNFEYERNIVENRYSLKSIFISEFANEFIQSKTNNIDSIFENIGIPSHTTVTNNFEYGRNIVENRYSLKSIFISKFANEFMQSKTNNIDSIFENINNINNSNSVSISDDSEWEHIFRYAIYSTTNSDRSLSESFETCGECNKLYSYLRAVDSIKLNRKESDNLNRGIDNYYANSSPLSLKSSISHIHSLTSKNKLCLSISISLQSIFIIKSDTSLGLSSDSYDTNVVRSISVISFADSNLSADSSLYLLSKHTGDCRNNIIEESDYNINDTDYDTKCEYINSCLKYNTEAEVEVKYKKDTVKDLDKDHVILQLSEKEHDKKEPNRDSVLVINDLNNDEDVIHIVEEVILKKSLSNMSSIFLVVSSSEYESDTNDKESSMMCIQMSKNSSMWYNGIKRRKLVSSAQGLKISAKGKKYPLANVPPKVNDDDIMRHLRKYAPVDDRTRREQICQTVDVNKPIKQRAVHRVISLDSTQDKPCCCPPKEEKLYQNVNVGVEYASSVASELITPMIANQSIAQGLYSRAYCDEPNVHTTFETLPRLKYFNKPMHQMNHTPVRLCSIPPCSGHSSCHYPDFISIPTTHGYTQISDFSTEKNREKFENIAKETRSVGCGGSKVCLILKKKEETDNNLCSKCCYLKIADGRTIRCQCSGAEKKLKLKLLCPCEVYEPPQSAEPTISIKTSKKEKEEKKRKRKWNKNVKCECPQDGEEVIPPIEPSEPFLPLIEDKDNIAGFEWKDTKEIIKLKSDLTQTTSGFKFDVKPRPALESLMSFEEALQYYAEHPSEADAILAEEQDVLNADKPVSIKKTGTVVGIKCACPYEPPPLGGLGASDSENIIDLKKGFKFHVDGKGSASPGLSGICCFDMVQQTTRSQLFPSHSSLFL